MSKGLLKKYGFKVGDVIGYKGTIPFKVVGVIEDVHYIGSEHRRPWYQIDYVTPDGVKAWRTVPGSNLAKGSRYEFGVIFPEDLQVPCVSSHPLR